MYEHFQPYRCPNCCVLYLLTKQQIEDSRGHPTCPKCFLETLNAISMFTQEGYTSWHNAT